MKKAIIAIAVAAFASTATADIAGSPHDLSGGYNGGLDGLSACQFCHAPHYGNTTGGVTGYGQIPLWNRRDPTAATQALYRLHTTATTPAPTLGAGSFTCLSCHDGSSDIAETYRGAKGFSNGPIVMQTGPSAFANVSGTYDGSAVGGWVAGAGGVIDLRDDHPVGVTYVEGGDYETEANVTGATLKLYAAGAGAVTVECGTCHDPHSYTTGGNKFLRVTADLCTSCHLK